MNGIDFNNSKGSNLGDPKFGQDAVNLRTANIMIGNAISNLSSGVTTSTILATGITTTNFSSNTISANTSVVNSITASTISANTSVINSITASTIYADEVRFKPITYAPTPDKGLMFFDDATSTLYIYTGNTIFDLVALT